jgi:hypothetical protein
MRTYCPVGRVNHLIPQLAKNKTQKKIVFLLVVLFEQIYFRSVWQKRTILVELIIVEPKTGFKKRKINKYIDFETQLLEQGATPLQHCGR